MKAFAQPLAGIVRVGPDTDGYGKPWDYAVTYSSAADGDCVLLGLKGDGKFTTAHRRAIIAELRRLGFHRITWDRIKDATTRQIQAP